MKQKLLITLTFAFSALSVWSKAADSDIVPQTKGAHCTFKDGVRYSELVINARTLSKTVCGIQSWSSMPA